MSEHLLENYMGLKIPLLVEQISSDCFPHSVVIQSNIDKSELNGHYENTDFCPPRWYQELLQKSKANHVILVIENINEIELEEQTKFIEILKYKKVSTFDLPENCSIVVTCSNHKINEQVYSLLAQI